MALEYATGNVLSQWALAQALIDFIQGLGGSPKWTVHAVYASNAVTGISPGDITGSPVTGAANDVQLTLKLAAAGATPTECYFTMLTGGHATNPALTGHSWTRDRIAIRPHKTFSANETIVRQPDGPMNGVTVGTNGKKVGIALPKTSSMNYHFWCDDTYLIVAVEVVSGGWWQSFMFGLADMFTGCDGGYYCIGTCTDDFGGTGTDTAAYNSTTLVNNIPNMEGGWLGSRGSILGFKSHSSGAYHGFTLSHYAAGVISPSNWNGWEPTDQNDTNNRLAEQRTPSVSDPLRVYMNLSHPSSTPYSKYYYGISKARWKENPGNAVSPLTPLWWTAPTDQFTAEPARLWGQPCRQINGLYYVPTETINPGDIITVGTDDYFVFPAFGSRNIDHYGRYIGAAVLMP